MNTPFRCPNCNTHGNQLNILHQSVNIDPSTGQIIHELSNEDFDSFQVPYMGPEYQVQCRNCGFIEAENSFIEIDQLLS